MTPTLRCNQRCIFCWRSIEHEIEDSRPLLPEEIIAQIPAPQRKGLSGDKPFSDPEFWAEATSNPTQFAVSLSGEPTLYPYLPELIARLREGGRSVFVVSNGTVPEMIEKIAPTQLYLSLDAVDVKSYEEICCPIGDAEYMWANVMRSMALLKQKEAEGTRTAIRITLVAGCNDSMTQAFAKIIDTSQPMYVEIKGYMYLGYSRNRLSESSVPDMDAIRLFASEIADATGYEIMDENVPSRVVCLRRKT